MACHEMNLSIEVIFPFPFDISIKMGVFFFFGQRFINKMEREKKCWSCFRRRSLACCFVMTHFSKKAFLNNFWFALEDFATEFGAHRMLGNAKKVFVDQQQTIWFTLINVLVLVNLLRETRSTQRQLFWKQDLISQYEQLC